MTSPPTQPLTDEQEISGKLNAAIKAAECGWKAIWTFNPELWDSLDEIEESLAEATGATSVEVNVRLVKENKRNPVRKDRVPLREATAKNRSLEAQLVAMREALGAAQERIGCGGCAGEDELCSNCVAADDRASAALSSSDLAGKVVVDRRDYEQLPERMASILFAHHTIYPVDERTGREQDVALSHTELNYVFRHLDSLRKGAQR